MTIMDHAKLDAETWDNHLGTLRCMGALFKESDELAKAFYVARRNQMNEAAQIVLASRWATTCQDRCGCDACLENQRLERLAASISEGE